MFSSISSVSFGERNDSEVSCDGDWCDLRQLSGTYVMSLATICPREGGLEDGRPALVLCNCCESPLKASSPDRKPTDNGPTSLYWRASQAKQAPQLLKRPGASCGMRSLRWDAATRRCWLQRQTRDQCADHSGVNCSTRQLQRLTTSRYAPWNCGN